MDSTHRYFGTCLLSLLFFAGCGGETKCTLEPRPGLHLVIRDSVSGAPAAMGAHVIAQDLPYIDSLQVTTYDLDVFFAEGHVGTHTIRVRKTGYRLWTRSNVQVPGGICGPDGPVTVQVRLQGESL